jgi:hypothetical protein
MPARAWSEEMTVAECFAANERAGPLRRERKLRESRANLLKCTADMCPKRVRQDCIVAAEQALADIPTVAFSVKDEAGNELSAVTVTVDGGPFADRLDGTAIEVDPGDHLFAFQVAGHPVVEKRFLILEGEKNRHEHVLLPGSAPVPVVSHPPAAQAAVSPAASPTSSRRTAGLVVGGSGLALLAVGAVSGLVAIGDWSSAKTACGGSFPTSCQNPSGASSDRGASVAAGTMADVTLGLGALALGTGALLFFTAPRAGSTTPVRVGLALSPAVGPTSGGLVVRGVF